VPRTRTTKKLAQRINLNYFKRSSPLRRWRTWLVVGIPALAVVWLVWLAVRRDDTVYSSGGLTAAHAVLNANCAACHVREAGRFSAAAADTACLACHDGPIHKENQMFTPTCASCHVDHRGPVRLAETNDTACTQCHEALLSKGGIPKIETRVGPFNTDHPEFVALRKKNADPGTIKLNHAAHLKKDLRGPGGKPVQLVCDDCHRIAANANRPWLYGTEECRPGGLQSRPAQGTIAQDVQNRLAATEGGRLIEPVSYEKACASCHDLQFDDRFNESAPHKDVAVVHRFILERFEDYIGKHPAELRIAREPDRTLTGRPVPPRVRVLTLEEWVKEKTAESEGLLWRKTCKQCHTMTFPPEGVFLMHVTLWPPTGGKGHLIYLKGAPEVARGKIVTQWMPHAKFSHSAHQMLTCTSCHAATTSKETSDVLMPSIATCRSCHNQSANGAESRCFLCHTYHDWSREKPVRGKFRLREISGGRSLQTGEQ